MKYPNNDVRRTVGFLLAPLIAPAVVAVMSIGSGFLPSPFRDGLFPLAYMSVAALGWTGIPFFFYLFGTPISYLVAFVVSLRYRSAMDRGEIPSRKSVTSTSAIAGAVTLGPGLALLASPKYLVSLEIVMPTVAGLVAGATASWLYWLITLRPMRTHDAAA